MYRINLTNVISFHLPSCLPYASTFRVIWSSWSPRPVSPRLTTSTTHYVCFIRCYIVPHRNLYFYCCSPEFSPFRPSSDSSSSSSHNAQNSHHEDKPKGSYFQEALLMWHCAIDSTFVFYLIFIGGAPNRPLPPTPDEEESGDRTLVMKRVSTFPSKIAMQVKNYYNTYIFYVSSIRIYFVSGYIVEVSI